jgi:hypothetical protein
MVSFGTHVSTHTGFDILLLSRDGAAPDARAILEAIEGTGHALRLRTDPGRYIYRNDDTGVSFQVMVSPAVAAGRRRAETDGDETGEEEEGSAPLLEEEPALEEGEEDEDAEEEEPFDVVMAPVTLTLPLLVPDFFLAEAVEFGLHVGGATDLTLEVPAIEGPSTQALPGGPTPAEILSAWAEASRAALLEMGGTSRVSEWSPQKAAHWWDYGRSRPLLEAELGPGGISVPPLRAAVHEGSVKTLVIWDTTTPTVLPRADLVLVRRQRERMGLLRMRKIVEEGIAAGAKVWDLLAPFSEARTAPVDVLIFREARALPSQVAAELEVLRLEPLESVRRTELNGVIVSEKKEE